MLLMKPWEPRVGDPVAMDTNGNKHNAGVREGYVLEEAWDVFVDPLAGTQRVTLCCTELLSPFSLIVTQDRKLLLL